jgi:hypothetical protein
MIPTAFPAVMGHADSTLQRHRSNDTHGRFIEFGVKPSDRLRRWDVSLPLSSDVLPYCINARISNATPIWTLYTPMILSAYSLSPA